jgi:hypothetical protein
MTAYHGGGLYVRRMHTLLERTYAVYRSTGWERPYTALGTVMAATRSTAREIARHRWRVAPWDDVFHVRAAGSVPLALLLEALTRDGEQVDRGSHNAQSDDDSL